uniref:Transposase n=1 Tax=Caenorhabditis tropicalis TaxID=1561998 RepID=A0A1I7SXW2_9PELO
MISGRVGMPARSPGIDNLRRTLFELSEMRHQDNRRASVEHSPVYRDSGKSQKWLRHASLMAEKKNRTRSSIV